MFGASCCMSPESVVIIRDPWRDLRARDMSQNPPVPAPSFELKHRIAGASILIILGVVVVPMILSGPKPTASPPVTDAAATNPDTKVFISKITPISGATPAMERESKRAPEITERAPKMTAKPGSKATPEPTGKSPKAKPVAKVTEPAARSAGQKAGRQRTLSKNQRTVQPAATAKTADKSIQRGWIVRVGTFSKPENTARIMSSLEALGFKPSSERVKSSRGVLTRVWVGPYEQRVEAGRARSRIQQKIGEKGLITAFP